MTLIVQNDQGTAVGANGYIGVDFLRNYWETRGKVLPQPEAELEAAIIRATDYLDGRFSFVGRKLLGRGQSTEWPRINARDADRYYVNGIPEEVKEATAEYALRALEQDLAPDPEQSSTGAAIQSKSESVGPISESVTYVTGSAPQLPRYPAADMKLHKAGLTRTGGMLYRG